jgi:hypothetical protein
MRARVAAGLGACVLVCVCAFAQPAAAATSVSAPLSFNGTVAASWHGDPARGCAEAGLCGYRGAVTVGSPTDGQFQIEGRHGHPRFVLAYANLGTSAVVRVAHEQDACVDVAPVQELDAFGVVRNGRVRFELSTYGLSAARCAGPDASEFVERLPHRTVSLARLRRGALTLDFSGRVPYGSGRFSGTIRSTLRMRIGRLVVHHFRGGFPSGARPPVHPFRVVRIHAAYRVAGFQGSVRSSFRGASKPFCVTVDSCGSTGTSGWAIFSVAGGTLHFEAEARARPSDRGVRGALAAIERADGFVDGYTFASLRHAVGESTADVRLADGSRCHDASRAASPGIFAESSGRRIEFALGGDGDLSALDLLRVGCPGPLGSDIFAERPLASGSVPPSALLRRRLAVSLTSHGKFHGFGYSGTRRARFGLRLRRVAVRATYRQVTR